MPSRLSRREFLASSSLLSAVLAGCLDLDTQQPENQNIADSPSPTRTANPAETENDQEYPGNGRGETRRTNRDTNQPDQNRDEGGPLNVLDYGAQGDGISDDTFAIQQAINDASAGETVFIPDGRYRISTQHQASTDAIVIDGSRHAENLTVEGESEETVLVMDSDHEGVYVPLRVSVRDGYEGLRLRNFTIDGNRDQQNGTLGQQVGLCLLVTDATGESVGNVDIRINDVKTMDGAMNGFTIKTGGVVLDSVSAVNNGRHGFALDSWSNEWVYREPIRVRNGYATRNGIENGNGYGFDLSGGKVVIENCLSEGNYQGTKSTEEMLEGVYRQTAFLNNIQHGYLRPGSLSETGQRSRILMEDVVSRGNGSSGFRFGRDSDYTIGSIVAKNNGSRFNRTNIRVRDDASISADEILSFNSSVGPGMLYSSSNTSTVRTYVHFGNPENGLKIRKGDLEIGTSVRYSPAELEASSIPLVRVLGVKIPSLNLISVPERDSVGLSS